ncbi:MAG: cytochrome c biogenesis protein CcsA [Desulfovibrio sp.]|nr:cytochrome c biogenesis protein CcsA [Desulfovibrio sp.]
MYLPFLAIGLIGIISAQCLIFLYAPIESTLGISQKIFYIHLPLAWWGLLAFFLLFATSILYLWKRDLRFHFISLAAGELGELLAVLTVATGSIWGKIAWGVWWTWDPRLTTALVLCFIYGGWLILRTMEWPLVKRATILSVTGIIAFLDVPLVFISARIWRSIHPAVFTSNGIGMTHEMILTVLFSIASFGLFFIGLLLLRIKTLEKELFIESIINRI